MTVRKYQAVWERDWKRAQEIKSRLHLAQRKKLGFTFRGLRFDVYRLDGENIVIHAGSILKNPPKKLMEKLDLYFVNQDVFEVMES
jgi:hypothetical protein